jgi:hypothetical protein
MDLLETKIILFGYITGRQNLTIAEKLSLLKFVKEASFPQLNYLLKEGRMVTEREERMNLGDWMKKHSTEEIPNFKSEPFMKPVQPQQAPVQPQQAPVQPQQAPETSGGGISAGEGAAAGALAVGAITAGVLAYKRFFSKAARACAGMSGSQKTACMAKYKVQGKKAEIATLNSKKAMCKGNPKCIAKIQARMQKAQAEMQ